MYYTSLVLPDHILHSILHTSISKGCLWHCLKYSFCLNRWKEIITRTVIPAARKKKHTAACSWFFVTAIEIILIILKLLFSWKLLFYIRNFQPGYNTSNSLPREYRFCIFTRHVGGWIWVSNRISILLFLQICIFFENPSKLTPVTWYMAANIDINDAHNRFTQKYIATLDWLLLHLARKNSSIKFLISKICLNNIV